MATTKTLAPTNQTITIAGFQGEKPDQRQVADAEGKMADAINALNSQIASDWTGCADYKETIESSANAVLQSFGKLRTLTFQGVLRSHTEDEVIMTLPSSHRPIGGNSIYAPGVVNGTPILIRLNGSNGQVALFLANGAGTGRIYFSMTWVAA